MGGLKLLVFLLISFAYTWTPMFLLPSPSRFSPAKNNCTRCKATTSLKLGLAEKRRIDILKKQIISKLGFTSKLPSGINKLPKIKTPRESETLVVNRPKQEKKPNYAFQEMSEIVSFSDENHGNFNNKNILTFSIDVHNNQGPLEALSAHLFILLRKRRRKSRRGKTVTLEVMKVADNSSSYDFLTIVRTRVKKTRWQKISLPVTLIQSMLESQNNTLQLKIMCKRCGSSVRPVIRRKDKRRKRRKHRKRNTRKRNKKQRKKRKRQRKRRMRERKTQDNQRIRPFLVISTRYRYYS